MWVLFFCEAGVSVSLKGEEMEEEDWALLKIQMLIYKYTYIHIIIFQEYCFYIAFKRSVPPISINAVLDTNKYYLGIIYK